jgi:hypothetical protein
MRPSILNADLAKPTISRSAARLIKFLIYSGAVVALLFAYFAAKFFLWARCFEPRGFVAGGSMCPAICESERILAGMDAFNKRVPRRGEVTFFDQKESDTKFTKRVVAVAGDTRARGPSNAILTEPVPDRLQNQLASPTREALGPFVGAQHAAPF